MSDSIRKMLQMRNSENSVNVEYKSPPIFSTIIGGRSSTIDASSSNIVIGGNNSYKGDFNPYHNSLIHGSIPNALYAPKQESKISHTKINQDKLQTIIIIPDIHSYQRDVKSYELCMESLKVLGDAYNVTKVVQLGDLLECGEASGHKPTNVYDKVPSYESEVDWAMNDFWTRVKGALPTTELIHLLGNHEHRMGKWLLDKLGRPGRMTQVLYESLIPSDLYAEMGVKTIPYGNENPLDGMYKLTDDLFCVHGWSFATNAAKAHLDRTMGSTSIIFGHIHRIQSYVRRNPVSGKGVGAWSFGALAKPNMFYQNGQPNDHCTGFGIVQTDGNYFNAITIPVLKDGANDIVVLPNGAILSA